VPVELAEIAAGLPAAASFAIAGGITAVRDGRRRSALNEAVHELRRPLQALSLAAPRDVEDASPFGSSLRMAAVALERLDREINGRSPVGNSQTVHIGPLVEAAIGRWRVRASRSGKSLTLRWRAGESSLAGSECDLAQALDNLITNAIEHGGERIEVRVTETGERLRIAVLDSGGAPQRRRQGSVADVAARIGGRRRHGYGLRVVARTAAEHGGDFRLQRDAGVTRAVLGLPLGRRPGDG
jgi:signal transduction histidine kinase